MRQCSGSTEARQFSGAREGLGIALAICSACSNGQVDQEETAGRIDRVRQASESQIPSAPADTTEQAWLLRDDGLGTYSAKPPAANKNPEGARPSAEKAQWEAAQARVPAPAPNSAVLAELRERWPDELVSVTVNLSPVEADWSAYKALVDDPSRQAFADARASALAPMQEPVVEWFARHDAKDVESFWAFNQVRGTVAAKVAAELLSIPNVVSIHLPAPLTPGVAYDGVYSRVGTRLWSFFTNGLDGSGGNRTYSGNRVRIGVFEAAMLNRNHVGWQYNGGGWSRLTHVKDCAQVGCPATGAPADPSDSHGTRVTQLAAGSIEGGQDPSFPGTGTYEQIRRSGHSNGSEIYFYTGNGSDPISRAIQATISDGVDILNLSLQFGGMCDRSWDVSGINAALISARQAGVLINACGGNVSHGAGCTIWYPGLRPDTLAVNGLDSASTNTSYNTLQAMAQASRGGLPIRTFSGIASTTPGIDLMAPGVFQLWFAQSGTTGYANQSAGGCSFATPVVSGAAADLRNAFSSIGWTTTSAEALMVNMLVLGDSWDADTNGYRPSRLSSLSGAGRIHMHWPSSQDLTAPWAWGWRPVTIGPNQWQSWPVGDAGPESSSITQWKWAAVWYEPDLSNVADLDFYVYDTCPPGGGPPVLVASDLSYDLRARFTLNQSQIAGKCLEMRVHGTAVPANSTRTVWSADYYHSGDPTNH